MLGCSARGPSMRPHNLLVPPKTNDHSLTSEYQMLSTRCLQTSGRPKAIRRNYLGNNSK